MDETRAALRGRIDRFRDVADQMVAFWEARAEPDADLRAVWVADVRGCVSAVVAAWSLLEGAARAGDPGRADSSRSFLERAVGLTEQAASAADGTGDPSAKTLATDLRAAFEGCRTGLAHALDDLAPPTPPAPRDLVAEVTGPEEVTVYCSRCGRPAAHLRVEEVRGARALVYHGLTHQPSLDLSERDRMFAWLTSGKLAAAHAHVKRNRVFEDGLDCYCPDCGAAYCRACMQLREEYDEGFYDCTWGTCPRGHTRIVHD